MGTHRQVMLHAVLVPLSVQASLRGIALAPAMTPVGTIAVERWSHMVGCERARPFPRWHCHAATRQFPTHRLRLQPGPESPASTPAACAIKLGDRTSVPPHTAMVHAVSAAAAGEDAFLVMRTPAQAPPLFGHSKRPCATQECAELVRNVTRAACGYQPQMLRTPASRMLPEIPGTSLSCVRCVVFPHPC